MLIPILSALIMLALLDKALRLERLEFAQLDAKLKFFAIRDDLRRLERRGEVDHDRWFAYMDTTLTRSITAIEILNVWHAFAFMATCDMRKINIAEQNRSVAMKQRPSLAAIHRAYSDAIDQLIRERHALLWRLLGLLAMLFGTMTRTRRSIINALSGAPETSTLLQYATP